MYSLSFALRGHLEDLVDGWKRHPHQFLARWIAYILALVNIGVGLAIAASGRPRFIGPTFEPLGAFAGGRVWAWSAAFLVSGILMAIPRKWPSVFGLWSSMFMHMVWTAFFLVAVLRFDAANPTAIIIHLGFAAISTVLLTEKVITATERG